MNGVRTVVCVLLALLSQLAWADRVVPSNRVESQLRVRAQPNSSSPTVGYLEPGDSAQLDDRIPHWYGITLDNGTRGYVSKAWSQVIADSVAPASRATLRRQLQGGSTLLGFVPLSTLQLSDDS